MISFQNKTENALSLQDCAKDVFKDLTGTLKKYLRPVSTQLKESLSRDHLSFFWISGTPSYTCAVEIPTFFTNQSQDRRRVKL